MKVKIILWIMQSKLYKYLLAHVIPFIRFSTYYTSLRGKTYHEGYNQLCEGDIVLTTDKKKLTTLLIGGKWTHAALCVSKDGVFEVAEMTMKDYTESCFFDLCKEADHVKILRPPFSAKYMKKFVDRCKTLKNCTYDIQFSLGIEALYCSELIYHSDFLHQLNFDLSDFVGIGRKYLSPDGIDECMQLKTIWEC